VLDKKYQVLAEENSRLKAQFKLQEEDRGYLIRQTVALKKENAALRGQVRASARAERAWLGRGCAPARLLQGGCAAARRAGCPAGRCRAPAARAGRMIGRRLMQWHCMR
jgi:hypothetical protein